MKTLGQQLKALRGTAPTLNVAERANISVGLYRLIEAGKGNPTHRTILTLSRVLDAPLVIDGRTDK